MLLWRSRIILPLGVNGDRPLHPGGIHQIQESVSVLRLTTRMEVPTAITGMEVQDIIIRLSIRPDRRRVVPVVQYGPAAQGDRQYQQIRERPKLH